MQGSECIRIWYTKITELYQHYLYRTYTWYHNQRIIPCTQTCNLTIHSVFFLYPRESISFFLNQASFPQHGSMGLHCCRVLRWRAVMPVSVRRNDVLRASSLCPFPWCFSNFFYLTIFDNTLGVVHIHPSPWRDFQCLRKGQTKSWNGAASARRTPSLFGSWWNELQKAVIV